MNRKDDHQSNNSSEQSSKESLEQSNEQSSIESTKEPKSNEEPSEESRKESSGDAIKKVKKPAISYLKGNCRWFGAVVVVLGVFGLGLGLGYIFDGYYKICGIKGLVMSKKFIKPSLFLI